MPIPCYGSMSLADLLFIRLGPITPPSPPPRHHSSFHQLQTQNKKSSGRFLQLPIQVLDNIVHAKKSVIKNKRPKNSDGYKPANHNVLKLIDNLIAAKKNKLKILKSHLPSPGKPEKVSFQFQPSFRDKYRGAVEEQRGNTEEEEVVEESGVFQSPVEYTPIDLAVVPNALGGGEGRKNYQEDSAPVRTVRGRLRIPEESTPIDDVVTRHYHGWGHTNQHNTGYEDAANMNRMMFSASNQIESRHRNSSEYVFKSPENNNKNNSLHNRKTTKT